MRLESLRYDDESCGAVIHLEETVWSCPRQGSVQLKVTCTARSRTSDVRLMSEWIYMPYQNETITDSTSESESIIVFSRLHSYLSSLESHCMHGDEFWAICQHFSIFWWHSQMLNTCRYLSCQKLQMGRRSGLAILILPATACKGSLQIV